MRCLVCFLIVLLIAPLLEARVFNFKDENFASYLRGTYGFSRIAKSPFDMSSGSDTSFDKEIGSPTRDRGISWRLFARK